jgi:hypothetical protein
MINHRKIRWLLLFSYAAGALLFPNNIGAQISRLTSGVAKPVTQAKPLEQLYIINPGGNIVSVTDGDGKVYLRTSAKPVISFTVGGALGKHIISVTDNNGKKKKIFEFEVIAHTEIDDGGYYKDMFHLFYQGMFADVDAKEGTFEVTWNGKTYHVVVPWVLDNFHTMKGIKYFLPNGQRTY